jgi:hypothetical protein
MRQKQLYIVILLLLAVYHILFFRYLYTHAWLTSQSRDILLVARVLEDRVLFLSSSLISTIVYAETIFQ